MKNPPQGWHSRGYLPHYDSIKTFQFVTFRLADSLPQNLFASMEQSLVVLPESERTAERYKKIEKWLDAGIGCCALQNTRMAQTMQEALQKFDGKRYTLIAWCIMPNHVHVLIETKDSLAKIVQSWKSFTGRWAMKNNDQLGLKITEKRFWMKEYWDRYIRDEDHFLRTVNYIHDNPVKAGLCIEAHKWQWSSASYWNNPLGPPSSSWAYRIRED